MLDFTKDMERTSLQGYGWPPVRPSKRVEERFEWFSNLSSEQQRERLASLRDEPEQHGEMLHRLLDTISAYIFGYVDSPCHGMLDPPFEGRLLGAKLVLESELLNHWLRPAQTPEIDGQVAVHDYLVELSHCNSALTHPLFDYVETQASPEALATFLRTEVMRNEVVDDEVAMCVCGLQGAMKLAMVSNLWDECGRGKLRSFHTYWLRRLLEARNDWTGLLDYRSRHRPWYTQITTNVFNVFLTRPGWRLCSYGWFATNESWVAPHFDKIVVGLKRTRLYEPDVAVYFDAHRTIDPTHTLELLGALKNQRPELKKQSLQHVMYGAHAAVAAATMQYDRMLDYLISITRKSQGASVP